MKGRAKVIKSGQMARNMLGIGSLIRQTAMENSSTQMVMSTKVSGLMTKLMVMASTFTPTVQYMRVNG